MKLYLTLEAEDGTIVERVIRIDRTQFIMNSDSMLDRQLDSMIDSLEKATHPL